MVHIVVITALSIHRTTILKKPVKQIEVTYAQIETQKPKVEPANVDLKEFELKKRNDIEKNVKLLDKSQNTFEASMKNVKDVSKLSGKFSVKRDDIAKLRTFDMGRKVTVPLLKSEKMTNPKYLNYNDRVRQKIKGRAYQYVDSASFEPGEVYMTFVIGSDGFLKQAQIIDEKTSANMFTKSIGLRSIQESSPFPPFPKDLNYPELTFNVVISFQAE